MKILVTHPGRQHSHRAALALAGAGMLAGYWSGVPAAAAAAPGLPPPLRRRLAGYQPVPLPPALARAWPPAPALRRAGDALLPRRAAAWIDLLACRLFDRWAAAGLRRWNAGSRPRPGTHRLRLEDSTAGTGTPAQDRARLSAVIACEISASTTLAAARRLGITAILDAPSLHHQAQDRLHGTTDSPALHRRITRIKDREIELADHILTVSALARQTYLDAGVPAAKVHAVPLGADLDLFTPGDPADRGTAEGGPDPTERAAQATDGANRAGRPFRFLFCGAALYRKGFDLLLQAFDQVAATGAAVELRTAGPAGDASSLLALAAAAAPPHPAISQAGKISQPELVRELRRADCLVLPSRNDSYGMVVPEALACGLPVLVSDMVGAAELVEAGRNGWIVPAGDGAALAARMAWCAAHPAEVRALRPACRASAAAATWPAYDRRLTALLRAIVPRREAAP